jgi:hypothetical protein
MMTVIAATAALLITTAAHAEPLPCRSRPARAAPARTAISHRARSALPSPGASDAIANVRGASSD